MIDFHNLKTVATGAAGIGGVQLAATVPDLISNPEILTQITQAVVQIILGAVTLYKLLKDDKKNNQPPTQ